VRDDPLNYDRLMEEALREVVRRALTLVGERGLPGQHHFYVTFRTDLPGVDIPDSLRRRYPKEMTIVLQHQFWGLEIGAAKFEVTLSFDSKHERLVIPFAAITAFVDPSVQFGLQFPGATAADAPAEAAATPLATIEPAAKDDKAKAEAKGDAKGDGKADAKGGDAKSGDGRVVALDAFRKK
jgi:hypothetical protein